MNKSVKREYKTSNAHWFYDERVTKIHKCLAHRAIRRIEKKIIDNFKRGEKDVV